MRIWRIIAAVVVIVVIAAVSLHIYRDSIAMRVANSALSAGNVVVSGVSVESIGADVVRFSQIALALDSGTAILIDGVTLPVTFVGFDGSTWNIDKVEVVAAEEDGTSFPIADSLRTYLNLPSEMPSITIEIAELFIPPLPAVRNIAWSSRKSGTRLDAEIDNFVVTVESSRNGDDLATASVTVKTREGLETLALEAAIRTAGSGFHIAADSRFQTAPILPILHAVGVVPESLTEIAGSGTAVLLAQIDTDPQEPVRVDTEISLPGEVVLKYEIEPDDIIDVRVMDSTPIAATLSYPAFDWAANASTISIEVSLAELKQLPVVVSELSCMRGITCTFNASSKKSGLNFGEWRIANMEMSAPITVNVGDEITASISSDAQLSLSSLKSDATTVDSIDSSETSGIDLIVDGSGWVASSEHLVLRVEKLVGSDSVYSSFTAEVRELSLDDRTEIYSAAFGIESYLTDLMVAGLTVAAPDVSGSALIEGDILSVGMDISTPEGGIHAHIAADYDLTDGAGHVAVSDAELNFTARSLSANFLGWPYEWDVIAGSVLTTADIRFLPDEDGQTYSGGIEGTASDLSGNYGDIAFFGLNMPFRATLNPDSGIQLAETEMSLAEVDIGVPVTHVSATLLPDLATRTFSVPASSLTMLGGSVQADPFTYDLSAESNKLMLHIDSVQLPLMVGLAGFDSISMTGSVSGQLPATIRNGTIRIEDGRLESDGPGGVIRYGAGEIADDVTDNSQLAIVTRTLGNFEFASLKSDVSYTEEGDLKLQMRMAGVNPDMDPDQPVILNLSVDNNIPDLLRSLQATRSIEEILEERLAK